MYIIAITITNNIKKIHINTQPKPPKTLATSVRMLEELPMLKLSSTFSPPYCYVAYDVSTIDFATMLTNMPLYHAEKSEV